jgi:hypothetical protein
MTIYQVRRTVKFEKPEDKGPIINSFQTWKEATEYSKKIFETKKIESYITKQS